jgi:hypothetical protein
VTGIAATCIDHGTMIRSVYDYLSNVRGRGRGSGSGGDLPPYTIVRLFGAPPIATPGVTKHLYTIHRADDFIHFRAAIMMDLLGDPLLAGQVERILRDFLRYSTIRERHIVLRVGNWWGEFTVNGNPEGGGTLMLESGEKSLQTDTA